ncbi:MAG: aspartate aminotransferase family protein [Zetaproteobacteria bacterium]|nr:MAG: aspartate aminotransferase family protein [Zetaproteobacteria bacterium]
MTAALIGNYARAPIAIVRGEGCWLWDDAGHAYLDFTSGVGVVSVGHAHPQLARAICEQAQTLLHASNLFQIPQQELLAERLRQIAGFGKAFFCNSGAEANEAAIKLARRWAYARGDQRRTILALKGSFHGRTLATVAATMQAKVQTGFDPLPAGFRAIEAPTEAALEAAWGEDVLGVIVEPIQGEGGVRPFDPAFLQALRKRCDEAGALLIFDEVQTGIGRTGAWFAFQDVGVKPDILTLAKGLGGGVPIGAMLARDDVAEAFTPGTHGSTFGGNPLAAQAALAVLEIIEREELLSHVRRLGEALGAKLRALFPEAVEVRGRGLMWGVEMKKPVEPLIEAARNEGLLVLQAGERVLRLLPPLVLSDEELSEGIARLARAKERMA